MRRFHVRLIIAAVFLILMVFSTRIVVSIAPIEGKQILRKSNIAEGQIKDPVFSFIDEISSYNGLLKNIELRGWAFCETEFDNNEKNVELYFVSDKATYVVAAEIHDRTDVVKAYPDLKVPGINNGWYSKFSPLLMKEGTYNLFIRCYENSENYGIVDSGKVFVKHPSGGLREYLYESQKVQPDSELVLEDIKSYIDDLILEDNSINLRGWAFIDDVNMSECDIFVCFIETNGNKSFYSTQKVVRNDVADAYDNKKYTKSGFFLNITEDVPENIDKVTIMIKKGNQFWMSQKEYDL